MRTALIGAALLVVGAVALVTGILPLDEAVALVGSGLAGSALRARHDDRHRAGGTRPDCSTGSPSTRTTWARGRSWLLWLIVVALATVCTIFLSLDTTAVLLTPVVIVMARHVGISPLPFAFTTVWLANTASMLLPVSNLTNLLAAVEARADRGASGRPGGVRRPHLGSGHRRDRGARGGHRAAPPAQPVHALRHRAPERIADPTLLVASAVAVVILIPGLLSGLPVWIPACVAAVTLVIAFVVSRPAVLRFGLVPWPLLLLVSGLFLVLEAAHALGLGRCSRRGRRHRRRPAQPAPARRHRRRRRERRQQPARVPRARAVGRIRRLRMVALLIGVNVGPLITPWASLATLLWHDRLHGDGRRDPWSRYALLGLLVAPLAVVAATGALALR